jgi:DnaJ-class molecular chaperone
MEKKDYYKILNVEKNSSIDDIKKSYKKLALLYHPDKNKGDEEATNKFKELSEAYSVLSNDEKRKQYDMLGNIDDEFDMEDPFSVFNNIFHQHVNSFMNMKYENDIHIGSLFSNLSGLSESEIPFGNVHVKFHTFHTNNQGIDDIYQDIENGQTNQKNHSNNMNHYNKKNNNDFIGSIFKNVLNNIKKKGGKEKDSKESEKIIYDKPEPIIYNITVSLEDIYNKKNKKISIKKMKKTIEKKKIVEIPIYGREILLEEYGNELDGYQKKGDIIINILNKKDESFKRVNEYDILTYKDIKIEDIYSFLLYDIELPNKEIIKIQSEPLLNQKCMIQKIVGKGLPYKDEDNKDNKEEDKYGNLYVIYQILFPKTLEELKKLKIDKNNSSISEERLVAHNCDFNEILSDDFENNI